MSADNSRPDVLLPIRNLWNSVKCSRDRVRDGEPNENSGTFSLSNFWEILNEAVKATSQEATKLSLMFSAPPSEEDCAAMAESLQKSVLTLTTVYFWLPKSQGVTLRRAIRDATADALDGLVQLLDVILTTVGQSLSQEQLTSTGGVWAACDQFNQLPKDNRSAVLAVLTSCAGLVKDALEEMEQALSEAQDPFADVLEDDDDDDEGRGNQDSYWSESDRQLVAQCQGLMKASGAALRKLSSAVRSNGRLDTEEQIAQLDDLADTALHISPSVDDLALSLYPPVERGAVQQNVSHASDESRPASRSISVAVQVCKLACVLKKVLEITRSSHVCGEAEVSWVEFLSAAVDHNQQKVETLLHGGS